MKTSYHYFTFIIISLLLHYLFFYFTDTKEPVNSKNQQVLNAQPIDSEPITNQVNKPKIPIVIEDIDNIKLDSQISKTIMPIEAAQITNKNTNLEPKVKQTATQSEIPSALKAKIQTPNKNIPTSSYTEPNTEHTAVIEAGQVAQQIENKKMVALKDLTAEPETLVTSLSENKVIVAELVELDSKRYLVTTKTHKATEAAIIKAELFNQEIADLPKLPKKRHVKKKVIVRATKELTKTQKQISAKLITYNDSQNEIVNNRPLANTTIKAVPKTSKPTFKPKVDTKLLSLSNSIKLPEAVAISGKKPNYPQVAAKFQKKGQVVASMTVLPTGSTREAEIVKSSGYKELDQAVIEFIAQERFMPSLQGQDKVSSKQIFSFSYE